MPGQASASTSSVSAIRDDGQELLALKNVEGLVSLAQASVLEIHAWGATLGNVEKPDGITFDLDPDSTVEWTDVVTADGDTDPTEDGDATRSGVAEADEVVQAIATVVTSQSSVAVLRFPARFMLPPWCLGIRRRPDGRVVQPQRAVSVLVDHG